jgi:ADP-ribose pyrophosphatase YjhB (NUDIX family)
MYYPKKIENKYGDILYINSSFVDYQDHYDSRKPIVLKFAYPIELPFYDFEFSFVHDSHFIYLNQKAKKLIPPISTNGYIESSIIVFCLMDRNEKYYLMVKDKYKKFLTCPGGSKQSIQESFLDCAIRELYEETSIRCNQLREFGTFSHKHSMFSMNMNGLTKVYYGQMNVNKHQLQQIKNYTNEEIEKVILVSSSQLDTILKSKSILEYKFYRHHVVYMKYMDMYYKKLNYDWIKDIEPEFRSELFLY